MRYGIGQDYEYVGHDYWKWRSWLVSENGALDAVTQVEWFLHPTFPTSRIVCTDRERRFLLETAGWGTFELRANVHLVTGEVVKLSHRLVLEYPPDSDVSGTEQAPSKRVAKNLRVYLSYGSEDAEHAQAVKFALQDYPIDFIDATSVKPGDPFGPAVRRMIRQSDAVIGLVGTDTVSPILIDELNEAKLAGKQVLTMQSESVDKPFGLPAGLAPLRVNFSHMEANAALGDLLGELKLKL